VLITSEKREPTAPSPSVWRQYNSNKSKRGPALAIRYVLVLQYNLCFLLFVYVGLMFIVMILLFV
jgi:hypothetical protein